MSEPTSPSHDETNPVTPSLDANGFAAEGPHIDLEKCERVTQAIMFTDIESSVNLAGTLGADRYAEVLTRHGKLFHEALASAHAAKVEKHTGDGFMVRFEQPEEAVGAALRFQWLLRREVWNIDRPLRVRIGIHLGEILLIPTVPEMPGTIGTAVNLAARVLGMADGGQILLTRAVFDQARQSVKAISAVPAQEQAALGWEAHGAYLVKGIEGPVEIFEVGERGRAPFRRPRNGPGAERSVSAEEEATLGWRPAADMEVPKRTGWRLLRPLGQGGFGEVWLAEHRQTAGRRVFKFCFDVVRLRSLKREVALFQVIQKALGPRRDIATLYDVQLETSPFFLESEYCGGGTLDEWLEKKLRDGEVPLARRLAVVAAIARALAAAHSVGIIHKDVKPSNIFIEELPDGTVQPRLADFGIGELANRTTLEAMTLGQTGLWTMTESSTRTGTQMYSAPEYMLGAPASIPGDIFSLGVLLYQVVVEDFHRPIGDGWRRDVTDPLLAEDIAACVDVRPVRRLSSATNLAERLETLEQRRAEQAARDAAAQRERELEEKVRTQHKNIRLAIFGTSVAVVVIAALGVAALMFRRSRDAEVHHSKVLAEQYEKEQDERYREDMIAAIADIDNWRGEAARELIERHRPMMGERDRRGWEWWLANSALNPRHDFCRVSEQPLRALAVSPDEKYAAVGGDDGDLSIWSCDTMEKTGAWPVGPVRSLSWKGGLLAIGLASGDVALWEVATQHELRHWKAGDGAVSTLAWDPVRDELTTGGENGVIAWWGPDGTWLKQFKKEGPVLALDWEADGSQLAAVLGNPTRLIAAPPDKLEHEFPMEMPDSAVAWRPGANEVAVSMRKNALSSFDPHLARDIFSLPRRFSPGASAYAWAADGARVAIGGVDGKIIILDTTDLKEIRTALYGHDHRVTAMRWLRRERLLSIGDDGTLRAWDDLQRPLHVHTLSFNAPLGAAQWHPPDEHPPDGRLAVLVAGDEVRILDAAQRVTWMRPMPPPIHGQLAFAGGRLAWSPDGLWLAAVCPGRGLVAWRVGGEERFQPAGMETATDVQWLNDSRTLLVRTLDGWFRLSLDAEVSKPVANPRTAWMGEVGQGLFGKVSMVADTIRFTVSRGDAAPAINIPLPKELGTVHTCALSADRSQLAVGGETGAVVWLDTRSGKLTRPMWAHSSTVQAMGWNHDGSRLVTASSDGTGRVIDVAHVAETWVVEQLNPEIVSAGWSADERHLMFASGPGREVKFYDIAQTSDHAHPGHAQTLLAAIEDHPDEESAWNTFVKELGADQDEQIPALRAAAELGVQARFAPFVHLQPPAASPATTWQGSDLPRVLQVTQACALEHWEDVLKLSTEKADLAAQSWFALARAEALAHLGRNREAELANLEAWKALRRYHGALDPARIPGLSGNGKTTIDLAPWPTARCQDDWVFEEDTGNENNNLLRLLDNWEAQRDGVQFQAGDFILLCGRTMRLTTGRMLPRSTGWIPMNAASRQVSCVVAASNVFEPTRSADMCIGSIFLLRQDGGAVRIPLIFGQNIWGWWVWKNSPASDAQKAATAWEGDNARAAHYGADLALYRLNWTAQPGESPVVAISVVSTVRQPAPFLMSVDARP